MLKDHWQAGSSYTAWHRLHRSPVRRECSAARDRFRHRGCEKRRVSAGHRGLVVEGARHCAGDLASRPAHRELSDLRRVTPLRCAIVAYIPRDGVSKGSFSSAEPGPGFGRYVCGCAGSARRFWCRGWAMPRKHGMRRTVIEARSPNQLGSNNNGGAGVGQAVLQETPLRRWFDAATAVDANAVTPRWTASSRRTRCCRGWDSNPED